MNILIIGTGNLGKRHLESLKLLSFSCNIYALDPSAEALANVAEIVDEEEGFKKHKVQYCQSLDEVDQNEIGLAIIATNSNHRFQALNDLVKEKKVEYLVLEKFLFPRLGEYEKAKQVLLENNVTAWVNCPRRMFPEFQAMKKHFSGSKNASFSAEGNMWGLACNGIHALDLFAYLTDDADFSFSTELLDNEAITSGRSGYVEFTGTIFGTSTKGNFCKITSTGNPVKKMPAVYTISNDKAHFIVHRGYNSHYDYALAEEGWEWKQGKVKTPFQSELTFKIVEQLKNERTTDLAPFDESVILHRSLLKAFIEHSQKLELGFNEDECMIS